MDNKATDAKSISGTNVGYENRKDKTTFVTNIVIKTRGSQKCLIFVI